MSAAPGGPEGQEREAVAALEREMTLLVRRALRSIWAGDSSPDIDPTTYPLLSVLVDDGPMRVGELARHFRLDKSTVSRHVARLEAAGVVETRPDPRDGRCALLHPTPRGTRRLEEIRAARRAPLREVLATFDAGERADLARLLARVNRALEHRESAAPATDSDATRVPNGARTADAAENRG